MSLRHALIGLLAEQPASGWDLTRRFEDLLGTVWPAGHPQIYGELRKLEADGFIQLDSEGPRRRKTYRAIAAAKARGEYGDTPQAKSIRIAAEAGIRLHQALGDWATWAVNHQPRVP